MKIVKSTAKYESWLRKQLTVIDEDLRQKHVFMKSGPFPFLRATFYRWAQIWGEVCPHEAAAPEVLGVGDLHIENFGTWRDSEGRLVWGINDFDEAYRIPYTCDLVRLATSAHLAITSGHLVFSREKVCESLQQGYSDALTKGGGPYVFSDRHPALRQMATERLKDPEIFWQKLQALKTLPEDPPDAAWKALRRLLPDPQMEHRLAHRVSGLGSLGRRRYVALGQWHGGWVAREAKELCPSACVFADGGNENDIFYQDILDQSIRCPDPFVKLKGSWIVRRLAPDCSRIELASLPEKHEGYHLLHAMGWETANVHLGSASAKVLIADLAKRPENWLHHAAEKMAESVKQDWMDWHKSEETEGATVSADVAQRSASSI